MMQSAPHPPKPELAITLTIRSVSVIAIFDNTAKIEFIVFWLVQIPLSKRVSVEIRAAGHRVTEIAKPFSLRLTHR